MDFAASYLVDVIKSHPSDAPSDDEHIGGHLASDSDDSDDEIEQPEDSERLPFFCKGSGPGFTGSGLADRYEAVVASSDDVLWENGDTITYKFYKGHPNQKQKVVDTIKKWAECVNLVFKYETNNRKATHIRISFAKQENWSMVGRQDKMRSKEPTMMLGFITRDATITKEEEGAILHEWGHLLGLHHEHQREGFHKEGITWIDSECRKFFKNDLSGLTEAQAKIWLDDNVYKADPHTNFGDYDPYSIMLYTIPKTCYKMPGLSSLFMTENLELSSSDRAYMTIHYPKSTNTSDLRNALDSLNIPHRVSSDWDHTNVKQRFWSYVEEKRAPICFICSISQKAEYLDGQTEVYEVKTISNLWEFGTREPVIVNKTYSDFLEFLATLAAKGWTLPGFPPAGADDDTKVDALYEFAKEISAHIDSKCEPSVNCREELCMFLKPRA